VGPGRARGRRDAPTAPRRARPDAPGGRKMADAQAATAVLVRQGKVSQPVGAMVIPAQRGGVLFAVEAGTASCTSTGTR